jgi:class 3 adenylate cyclase
MHAQRCLIRAGLHTGEVVVPRTVTDLVAGSSLTFADRGDHQVKGITESWRLCSVEA